ncbi:MULTISPECIES: Sec-independent protein translocase protein TatB [Vibrio]|uniref:Sec-independent protein translocase protein TatB n=1 Tax=Vibrio TaxID=662 RepID=UPI0001B951B9|nr:MULTISPECIES: Sec-independent protein translocase protein TatB [Vibrio]MCM5511538.1 Sec-independent protein translocase subunit TatB [Vibrio sp. SCSIO 43169]EEX35137.1 twin-arginine translocation protein TatB [Vibrio coralliilyticus ATCC BAA-450]MDE3900760.1 Sec-independent protein translocase subunit TatB [Vibrio sp. CC007]QFT37931.1 Sec-independent protein translocase protein TatB [Vibrio sp. THAF64]QGM35834.1 Sec-independent protein translocase protein TatB [Vibrio sp. THAF191d]
MFDIGFWELVLISVVGLVVLGPERLPHAIRSVSRFVGAAKNMANSVKDELSHELKVQELQENLRKAEKMGMEDLSPELKSSVEELKQAAQDVQRPYASKSDSASTNVEAEVDKPSVAEANHSADAVESLDAQPVPQADKKAE